MEEFSTILSVSKKVIDVLIVAFVLYRVYVLLSRTRAVQLLVGFGLILFVDLLSRSLKLETTSWLITNVSPYLVFGLIVILQPELRRMVAQMGMMPIFRWFSPPPPVPLKLICEAVRDMAQEKTGSLICILRENRPQGIIDNSVALDAVITPELLETIFFKDSPLHDGAVLIEGNKVLAASCYLPISHSRDIKKTYGARHRAALGYSEESDAVIIVTSEETGKITVLKNGEMHQVRQAMLEEILTELLNEKNLMETVKNIAGK